MSRAVSRNNILAGLFLLGGVALAVVVSFVLSGATDSMHSSHRYTVLFSIADGAAGIKPGSAVLLGGQEIGKVRQVGFQQAAPRADAKPGSASGGMDIAVEVSLRAEFTFYTNADFFLERPLLGSLSTINIASLGRQGVNGATELPDGGVIRGKLAPPSFLAQAGVGEEQVTQVQELIAGASKAVSRISAMVDRYEARIDRLVANADDSVNMVRERLPAWTGEIDETLAGARKIGPIADDVAMGVQEARDVVRKTDAIVDDAGPKLSRTLTEVESAAQKVNRESVDRFNRAIVDAQAALETIATASSQVGGMLREQTPNIRRFLANARLASDQLKLAAIEIRSQPWRLLYSPTPKETETSVLYDTARNYAQAVSDLRAASEAIEAYAGATSTPEGAPGAAQASDHQTMRELREEFDRAFARTREAENSLLEILVKRAGESAPSEPKK